MEPQRCVWHIWRSLSGDLGRAVSQAVQGVSKAAAETVRTTVRAELVKLIRGVIDAQQAEAAETALQQLLAHPQGKALGQHLSALMERLFVRRWTTAAACNGCPGVVLARLPLAAQPQAQPSLRAASGTGGVVVGNLSQLRARSMAIGTPTTLSTSWEECPRSGQIVPPGQVSYLDALGV